MSQELATRQSTVPADLQEKVLLGGDLARLTPAERLSYYNSVCTSIGLNPLTRPFEYLVLNDRMVLYARKDCTDQLRDLHGISIEIASREVIDGVCVVTVRAKNMTERTDESVGAVPFMKENGKWERSDNGKSFFKPDGTYSPLGLDARSNAMMKAETKAKRRVTLSICGLGMFDESEIDTVTDVKKLHHAEGEEYKPLPKGAEMLAKIENRATVQGDGLAIAIPGGLSPQQLQDATAPITCEQACEMLNLAQSPKEIADIMNLAVASDVQNVKLVYASKDAAMKRLTVKKA